MDKEMDTSDKPNETQVDILLIEPFYGGSHAQLMDLLVKEFNATSQQSAGECFQESRVELVTMTDKKWHWRARTSALWLSMNIPRKRYKRLFITSVVNLAELVGLRRDLAESEKVLYFHENQVEYPVRNPKHRDYQYAYNQILSALVADKVVFNSSFNMRTFLDKMDPFLNTQPDHRTQCRGLIEPKCSVLYFPITTERMNGSADNSVLHIVWPHRWEHDKGPEEFFTVPEVFEKARTYFSSNIVHWGFASTKDEFLQLLRRSDIVISTALHEFYGVAVLEAAYSGAFPLVPNRLSYPELFPKDCIYNTRAQLVKRLKEFCRKPLVPRRLAASLDLSRFHWSTLKPLYRDMLLSPLPSHSVQTAEFFNA
ncbi:glycosyltransferase domain-containing protein 1-like [Tropilaelaps mercedesae]|uniref:tRNA-queuosine alpha-mannosyltransferase n=1 Tax=Tropilaelaps mercedesae TaxID=418985 RepID=A0A1V9WZM4_9ACAR|nr:glycosyltransferase domain-containing protein 1-like [Tropilaelaps mercedesae]